MKYKGLHHTEQAFSIILPSIQEHFDNHTIVEIKRETV